MNVLNTGTLSSDTPLDAEPCGAASDGQRAGKSVWQLVLVCLLGLLAWGICIYATLGWRYQEYSTGIDDSAAYIESARSFTEGKGFLQGRAFDRLESPLWEPISLWPPGYPLLMSPLIRAGIADWDAALIVALASGAVFILLVSAACLSALPFRVAAPLMILIVVMPAFTQASATCMSDAPYLALAAGSLLSLVRSARVRRPGLWLVIAGLTAGCAWCVRNVAVAVFAASALFVLWQALWLPWRTVLRHGLLWIGGCTLGCGWLVCRNLITFGKLNPYSMPSSDQSFFANTLDVVGVLLAEMSGLEQLHNNIVAGCFLILAEAGLMFAAGWFARRFSTWNVRRWLREHQDVVLYVAYALIYLVLLISARTAYRLGDDLPRFVIQACWPLWLVLGVGVLHIYRQSGRTGWRRPAAFTMLLLAALALQARAQIKAIVAWRNEVAGGLSPVEAVKWARDIPDDQVVLSDAQCVLRIFGRRHGRMPPCSEAGEEPLTIDEIRQAGADGMLWGIIIQGREECANGKYGEAVQKIVCESNNVPGFETLANENNLLVLKWMGMPDEPDGATTQPSTRPTTRPATRGSN